MSFYGIPIILKEGTSVESKETALSENISAIRSISEAIKSTLGPKGLSKMLVDSIGDVSVTKDAFTILDEIEVEHPAGKLVVHLYKIMTKNVITASPNFTILDIVRELEQYQISAIPVVDEGKVLGVVSSDLITQQYILSYLQGHQNL